MLTQATGDIIRKDINSANLHSAVATASEMKCPFIRPFEVIHRRRFALNAVGGEPKQVVRFASPMVKQHKGLVRRVAPSDQSVLCRTVKLPQDAEAGLAHVRRQFRRHCFAKTDRHRVVRRGEILPHHIAPKRGGRDQHIPIGQRF